MGHIDGTRGDRHPCGGGRDQRDFAQVLFAGMPARELAAFTRAMDRLLDTPAAPRSWAVGVTASRESRVPPQPDPTGVTLWGRATRFERGIYVNVWRWVRRRPVGAIESVRTFVTSPPTSRTITVDDDDPTHLSIGVSGQVNVHLTLRHPIHLDLPRGRYTVTALSFWADDPDPAAARIRERIG